jgi:hypothetical protein
MPLSRPTRRVEGYIEIDLKQVESLYCIHVIQTCIKSRDVNAVKDFLIP